MSLQNLISEMDADDILEVTRDSMVIKGNYRVVALFLQYYDEQYEDRERGIQIDRTREEKLLASPNEMRTLDETVKNIIVTPFKISKSKSSRVYPEPILISKAYIQKFGKKYDRSQAIEFMKDYLGKKRLTNKYRSRVLMSIIDIVNNTGERFKNKSKKKYKKIDWNALAIEYASRTDKKSIGAFLVEKVGYASGYKSFHKALDILIGQGMPIAQKKDIPVFSMTSTSSIG